MASLPASFHINALDDCKLCNECDFFKEEMWKFQQNVPLIYQRLFLESLTETMHCVIHSPRHMWFFMLFKRSGCFLDSMFNTCKGMHSEIENQLMEVISHVIDDR